MFPRKLLIVSTDRDPQASDEPMSPAAATTAKPTKPTSFEDFYRQEYRNMVGLAFVLTGNRWVAEDTAQDALTAAFRRWGKLADYDSPGAWVRRVTCNQAVSVVRRRVREAKAIARLTARLRGDIQDIQLDDDDESFWQAVRSLPARQAQAIALYYFDGYSVSEIADVLQCSEGSVKTHLSRGRAAVAHQLQLEQDDE
jgi:RNA polymerase sigma factor (sigma-70 family)